MLLWIIIPIPAMFLSVHTCVSTYAVTVRDRSVKPSSQYDAEPRVASRRVALRGIATRRVVHNFGEHARVRRTETTPIA